MSPRAGVGGKKEVGPRPLRDEGRDSVSRGHRLIRSLLGKRVQSRKSLSTELKFKSTAISPSHIQGAAVPAMEGFHP